MMKNIIRTLFWIFLVLFLISGVFKLLSTMLHITFGIIGVIMSFIWNILFNPIVLVLVVIYFIYRLNNRNTSK